MGRRARASRRRAGCWPRAHLVHRVHVHVLGAEVPPLEAVHWPEVALLPVCESAAVQELPATVTVPDPHILLLKLLGVGGAADKPEKLLSDSPVKDLLGGEQGEDTISQREPHLGPEQGKGSCPSPVFSLIALTRSHITKLFHDV